MLEIVLSFITLMTFSEGHPAVLLTLPQSATASKPQQANEKGRSDDKQKTTWPKLDGNKVKDLGLAIDSLKRPLLQTE